MNDSQQEQLTDFNGLTIVNIKWNKKHVVNSKSKNKNLPEVFTVDIPQNIANIKDHQTYIDSIESFAYNFLTKKFGVEVSNCQVYLPLT